MPTAVTTKIRACTLDEVLELGAPLFSEHYEEVATQHRDIMRLELHELRFRALEQQGMLLLLGAFVDGLLVGYSANVIANHLHYAGLVYAANAALFVAREHRGGGLGGRLIQRTEQLARDAGAQMIMWNAKTSSALDLILRDRDAYSVLDIVYARRLDG